MSAGATGLAGSALPAFASGTPNGAAVVVEKAIGSVVAFLARRTNGSRKASIAWVSDSAIRDYVADTHVHASLFSILVER